jgi:hypothetical protein
MTGRALPRLLIPEFLLLNLRLSASICGKKIPLFRPRLSTMNLEL